MYVIIKSWVKKLLYSLLNFDVYVLEKFEFVFYNRFKIFEVW